MADKIVIEVFKEKKAEDFTAALSQPDCRANAGSAAAYSAAMACALAERAAKICEASNGENERLSYIVRNCEILRGYMVNLIDEDVKSKRPFSRALKEGGAREIEATIQTASCIDAEIVNMMKPCMEFLEARDGCDPQRKAVYPGHGGQKHGRHLSFRHAPRKRDLSCRAHGALREHRIRARSIRILNCGAPRLFRGERTCIISDRRDRYGR